MHKSHLPLPFEDVMPHLVASGWEGALNQYGRGHQGVPVLVWAIRRCEAAVLPLVAHATPTILNQADDVGATALMAACIKENKGWAEAILKRGASVDQGDSLGTTALMIASRAMDEDWVRLMLSAGAAVDQRTGSNRTALAHAAVSGNVRVFRPLLSEGADPNFRCSDGESILGLLVQQGALIAAPDNVDDHVHRVIKGIQHGAKLLIQAGANPNEGNVGRRPLEGVARIAGIPGKGMTAAAVSLARLLLKAGGDPVVLRQATDQLAHSEGREQLKACLADWAQAQREVWSRRVPGVASPMPRARM